MNKIYEKIKTLSINVVAFRESTMTELLLRRRYTIRVINAMLETLIFHLTKPGSMADVWNILHLQPKFRLKNYLCINIYLFK